MKRPQVDLTFDEQQEYIKKAHQFVETQPAELCFAIAAELGLASSLGSMEYQRWAKTMRGED